MFPTQFQNFMQWAQQLSKSLSSRSNGSVRVNANQLAAAMAATIPGVPESFNINTLKALMDKTVEQATASAVDMTDFKQMTIDLISDCLGVYRVELSQKWAEASEDSLFERLDSECDLDFFWSQFEDLDDECQARIQQGWVNLPFHVQREHTSQHFDAGSASFRGKSFEYIQSYVMARAYRSYLKSVLEETLDAMEDAAREAKVPADAASAYRFFEAFKPAQVVLSVP